MSLPIYRVEFVVLWTGELRGWLGPVHIMNHDVLPTMEFILWLQWLRKTNLNPHKLLNIASSPAQPGSLTREPRSCLAHLSILFAVQSPARSSAHLRAKLVMPSDQGVWWVVLPYSGPLLASHTSHKHVLQLCLGREENVKLHPTA